MFTVVVSILDTSGNDWKRLEDIQKGSFTDYSIAVAKRFTVIGEYRIQGWKFEYVSVMDAYVSVERDGKRIVIGIRDPLK